MRCSARSSAGSPGWRIHTNLSSVDTFVVDRSERGKLALTGSEAKTFLHGQVTNDIEGLAAGSGCYAAFLTHKGKMLGDMRIFDLGDELLLDCERVALQELFNMIRRFKLGMDVELAKRTLEMGLFSVVGPSALPVGAQEHACARASLGGADVVLARTDVGVDVFFWAGDRDAVRRALEFPDGDEALAEVVRVESGRPRFGVDLDSDSVIPQEAGLNERAVSFTKGCYVGQETVARLYYRGKPNRRLCGLRLSQPIGAGAALRVGDGEVGHVTSPVVSPVLGPLALALVRREAAAGDTVKAGEDGATAVVVDLPFAM